LYKSAAFSAFHLLESKHRIFIFCLFFFHVVVVIFNSFFVCLFNLCFNHLSLIFFSVDFSLFEKRSILNIAEKKEKICMFCWTVSKNIIIFLNFAREFFANNIFFFFLASFLNSQIYAGRRASAQGRLILQLKSM